MRSQTELNERMRAILIDWMVEVQVQFRLKTETLYLAISIVNRYLASNVVKRSTLQLVGVCALFIASKYEEVRPPPVNDFVLITDSTYSKEQILSFEGNILLALGFKLSVPSPLCFLEQLAQRLNFSPKNLFFARYIMELGMLEPLMLKYTPSLQAATAIYITRVKMGEHCWDEDAEKEFRYTSEEVKTCAAHMLHAFQKYHLSKSLHGIRDKYSKEYYQRVSALDIEKLLVYLEQHIEFKRI